MPSGKDFDIYQSASGYVAVTNAVRRAILGALAARELDLPSLVKVTGKAKPTLSNLHVRELLAQGLVEEVPHPTDGRRKLYRLRARRIGSSDVPLDQLRTAVKEYVTSSPLVFTLPLARVAEVLLAGAPPEATLRAQGRALGAASAHVFSAAGPRDLLAAAAGFWEREGLARAGKIDLDRLEVEVEVPARLADGRDDVGRLLAGFLEGLAAARLGTRGAAILRKGAGRRVVVGLARRR